MKKTLIFFFSLITLISLSASWWIPICFAQRDKIALANQITQKLVKLNQQRTTTMTEHLTKMTKLLDKIELRLNTATGDTTATKLALKSARQVIIEAQTAVTAQADKVYPVDLTDETKIRTTAQEAIKGFKVDMQTAHTKIVAARQSIDEVLKALAKVKGEKRGQPSLAPTNTTNN